MTLGHLLRTVYYSINKFDISEFVVTVAHKDLSVTLNTKFIQMKSSKVYKKLKGLLNIEILQGPCGTQGLPIQDITIIIWVACPFKEQRKTPGSP